MKTAVEVLRDALALIERSGHCKHAFAYTAKEHAVFPPHKDAVSFCAMGACMQVDHTSGAGTAESALRAALPEWADGSIARYNDDKRCELKHVRALFRKAIRMENAKKHRSKP